MHKLTWFSDSHKACNSFSLMKVNGRHFNLLSLRFNTRSRGIRPISSGIYSNLLPLKDNTVIPLQLPSWNENYIYIFFLFPIAQDSSNNTDQSNFCFQSYVWHSHVYTFESIFCITLLSYCKNVTKYDFNSIIHI